MQVEDNLALESARYNEIIKTRVKQLQDKIDDQKAKLNSAQREVENMKSDLSKAKSDNNQLNSMIKSNQMDFKMNAKEL